MKNTMITVKRAVNSSYLRDICEVRGGRKGLDKCISWVHVLEIRDVVKESIDPDGMILTTGIGFTNKEIAVNFVKGLIEQNASALCIETALYYHEIDEDIIRMADENDLVLIEIPVISRFIDISKGINTMILSTESKLYNHADNYDSKLVEIETEGSLVDGIKYTAQYLNVDIAYIPSSGYDFFSSEFLENRCKRELGTYKDMLKERDIYCRGKVAIKKLELYGANAGYLMFSSTDRDINHFDILIMERLSSKLLLETKKETARREEKIHKETEWVKMWMEGVLSEAQLERRLRDSSIDNIYRSMFAFAIKNNDENPIDFHNYFIHNIVVVRPCFESQGLYILGFFDGEVLWYVVFSQYKSEETIERVKKAVEKIRSTENESIDYDKVIFAVGKIGKSYGDIHKSYGTVMDLLNKQKKGDGSLVIYDSLSINRIMNDTSVETLEEFIEDTLVNLTDEENRDLLLTLKGYFDHGGNKQKTSERLFIVRQTLYFRLRKIEEILGAGYDEGERRFAIEFAIRAYEYINGPILQKADKELNI